MNKQLIALGIIGILVTIGISGCLENKEVNKSIIVPLLEKVTATINKSEYGRNETINITLYNGLNVSIYSNAASCPPCVCIEHIEKKTSDGWTSIIIYRNSYDELCYPGEIKSGQSVSFGCKLKIWLNGTSNISYISYIESGVYRLVISYFTKEDNLSENLTSYTVNSNEFTIIDKNKETIFSNAYDAINGTTFRSIRMLEIGLGVDGPVLGHWGISFYNGTYAWHFSDYGDSGIYECNGWNITGYSIVDLETHGYYNKETGVLLWEGEEYIKVIANEEEAISYAKTDPDANEFIETWSASGYKIDTWAYFYENEDFWAVGFEADPNIITDTWYEIHFKSDGSILSKGYGWI